MLNYEDEIPEITPNTKHFKKINIKLLTTLMKMQTPTGDKVRQGEFLDWVEELGIDATYQYDSYGNLYVTKGESDLYPCVITHIDTVVDYNKNLRIIHSNNLIIGIDSKTGMQNGIGADPKCGVYFAIQMLKKMPIVKVAFYMDEESNMNVATGQNLNWYSDCSFVIQLDRRSFTNDVVEHTNGIQIMSADFKEEIIETMIEFGYDFNYGSATNVGVLANKGIGICALNTSNGSINEHMDYECCSIPHLLNAINFGYELLLNFSYKQWEFIPKKEVKANRLQAVRDWEDDSIFMEEDFYPNSKKSNAEFYHHSPNWDFTAGDYDYIEAALAINQCPACDSNQLIGKADDSELCLNCGSIYYIPINTNIKNYC